KVNRKEASRACSPYHRWPDCGEKHHIAEQVEQVQVKKHAGEGGKNGRIGGIEAVILNEVRLPNQRKRRRYVRSDQGKRGDGEPLVGAQTSCSISSVISTFTYVCCTSSKSSSASNNR